MDIAGIVDEAYDLLMKLLYRTIYKMGGPAQMIDIARQLNTPLTDKFLRIMNSLLASAVQRRLIKSFPLYYVANIDHYYANTPTWTFTSREIMLLYILGKKQPDDIILDNDTGIVCEEKLCEILNTFYYEMEISDK